MLTTLQTFCPLRVSILASLIFKLILLLFYSRSSKVKYHFFVTKKLKLNAYLKAVLVVMIAKKRICAAIFCLQCVFVTGRPDKLQDISQSWCRNHWHFSHGEYHIIFEVLLSLPFIEGQTTETGFTKRYPSWFAKL